MNMRIITAGLGLLLLAAATQAAQGQAKPPATANGKDTISRTAAERTALATVPGGKVKEGELETENGRLVWSFDIGQATTKNVTEVQVDALTGKLVSSVEETPADQAREAAADAAPAKAPSNEGSQDPYLKQVEEELKKRN